MKKLTKNKNTVVNERHRRLLKRISDNLGNGMSFGETMRLEGYSKSYSENPSQLLSTASWQDLTQEQIPDELLVKILKDLLHHKDWRARSDALDKAFKIKGKYKEKIEVKNKYSHITDEKLNETQEVIIDELVRRRVEKIIGKNNNNVAPIKNLNQ